MSIPLRRWGQLVLAVAVAACLTVLPWWWMQPREALNGLTPATIDEEVLQALGSSPPADGSSGSTTAAEAVSRIEGQVLLPGGEPAGDVLVVVQASRSSQRATVVTDASGHFRVDGLQPVAHVIEASHPAWGPAMAVGVRPGGAPIRMVLQGGRELYGAVLRGDVPVPGAVVRLGAPGLYPARVTTSDSDGRYRFAGLSAAEYQVVVTASGAGTGFRTRVSLPADGAADAIRHDIALTDAPAFRLTLTERATGLPAAGAVVTISDAPLHVVSLPVEAPLGVAEIDYLPIGEYYLTVQVPGLLTHAQRLFVTGEDLWIQLSSGAQVTGVVRDQAGNPIEAVQFTAVIAEANGPRWEFQDSQIADVRPLTDPSGDTFWSPSLGFWSRRDGTFALEGLPEGDVFLRLQHPGYATTVVGPLSISREQRLAGLELTLSAGRSLRGRVETAGGAGIPDAIVVAAPAELPAWVEGARVRTDATGVFRVDRLSPRTRLTVEHPDYGRLQIVVDVPENGLDDVILRFGLPDEGEWSGRVFTPRGRAASGAVVWLLGPDNAVPICQSTVDEDAWFLAVGCSGEPARILIVHPMFAPLLLPLGSGNDPRDWTLEPGGELDVVSQRNPVDVQIDASNGLPEYAWRQQAFWLDRWSRQRIAALAPGEYTVTCTADGFEDGVVTVEVVSGQRTEAVCPFQSEEQTFPVWVVDHMGAPVSNAVVFVDGVDPPIRTTTSSTGFITVESPPGSRLRMEAMHEAWGTGSLRWTVPTEPPSDPVRIALREPIGGSDTDAFLDDLSAWGIEAIRDFRSIVIDTTLPGTPAHNQGLRRGDRVLWFRAVSEQHRSLGLRRSGELVVVDLRRVQNDATP